MLALEGLPAELSALVMAATKINYLGLLARFGGVWNVTLTGLAVAYFGFSVVDIEPGQIAMRLNSVTRAQTAITTPGWTVRFPFIHSVHILDAAPHTYVMAGDQDTDALHVPRLTVRASDGSNFHFEDTSIIFQLRPADAVNVVRDGGTGDGFMTWMKPYVRSILRDEFGRESTIEVSDPTSYEAATQRAKDRLNQVLNPHGILVSQLVTPRPKFNDAYEQAIEERNALGNQEQVIKSNLDRAGTERERRLAEVDQAQNHQIQERRASLESDLAKAVTSQAQAKREADTYHIEKIATGQATLSAAEGTAKQLVGELEARYRARKAEIDAFRSQPVERVMERLASRLSNVTIHIQPYADDATPSRIQYENKP
jgi:regulator of protease activity HflC (stomatin/prohibitin superfamily)